HGDRRPGKARIERAARPRAARGRGRSARGARVLAGAAGSAGLVQDASAVSGDAERTGAAARAGTLRVVEGIRAEPARAGSPLAAARTASATPRCAAGAGARGRRRLCGLLAVLLAAAALPAQHRRV